MKSFYTAITLLILKSVFPSGAFAQSYTLKESEPVIKGPQHEMLLCPGGDFLTITYPYEDDKNPVIIERFDNKLAQRFANSLQDLSKEHYRASVYQDGRLFLLCSNKDGAVSRYEVNDKTGGLTGSPAPLFDLEGKEEDVTFFSGASHDKSFHYLLVKEHKKREKGEILQGVILDKQMNKIASFSYTTPEDRDDVQHYDYVLADNGTLSLIYNVGVKAKKDDYTPFIYTIVQVDAKGKTNALPLSGVPDGDLRNLSWTAQGNRLLFTGLLSRQKKTGYTAILSGSFDPATKKVADIRQTEVSTLLTKAPDFMKDIVTKGLPSDASLLKTVPLSDGSRALILEVNSDRFYQSHYAQAAGPQMYTPGGRPIGIGANTPSYSITYHNRGDVYVLKLDKTNTPQWLNVISKKQEEPDMVIAIGIACTTDDKDNVHIFFYDNKNNTEPNAAKIKEINGLDHKHNVFACVSVAPNGAMKKQFIDLEDSEFRLMLEKSVAETNNELCFMAIKTKKAFTETHLFNNASYRLGTAMIK